MQEGWELLFDSVDAVHDCMRIATGVISTIKIRPERMLKGLSADMLATDLAEYLVRKGKNLEAAVLNVVARLLGGRGPPLLHGCSCD